MSNWYDVYRGVVPSDGRAVLVKYSIPDTGSNGFNKTRIGIGRLNPKGVFLMNEDGTTERNEKYTWWVLRAAESGEDFYQLLNTSISINACDSAGKELKVFAWKELDD